MVPGGAMAAGAIDMGLALASGESFGKAAAGTIGTVLGGTLGSVFGPAGTLVGSMVGGMVGDKVGVALSVPSAIQYRAAELSKQASEQMLQAANLTKGSAEASFLFGSASSLSKRLDVEGLGGNKAAAAFQKEYAQREFFAKQAGSAADALNQTITNLKNQGLPPDTILKMVRPLQVQSDIAARNLADSNRKLKSSFDALPQQLQSALVSSISRMSTGMIEAAFANKITGLRFSADGLTFRGSGKVDDYTSGDPFKPAPKPAPQFNTGGVNTSGFVWRRAEGGLGDAVSKEMRMKPPGSNLVIANSSETIIPAAGGLGMRDFMNSLDQGFRKVSSLVSSTPYKVGLSTISSKSLTPPGWGSSPSAPMEVTNNITIHQQPGQDAEELAAIVAMRIGEVVAARKASQIM